MTEFVHISEVLPGVLAEIEQRMASARRQGRVAEQTQHRRRVGLAVAGYHRGARPRSFFDRKLKR